MATQVEKAIQWARNKVGTASYKGKCQAFVADAYAYGAGMPRRSASTANAACGLWRVSTSRAGIPVGAAVYFTSPTSPAAGHVGLYIGGNQVIHAFGKVKIMTVDAIIACGYRWKGWGWNGGVKPTGAGSAAAATAASTAGAAQAVSRSTAQAAAIVHIPQTERIYTAYEGDEAKPYVDAYRVTWQSVDTGLCRDITARTADLTLQDDADSLCLELSFTVLENGDERFVPKLAVEPGDLVAVHNEGSGACVFLGQVQRAEGSYRDSLTVRCLDGGRALTGNEIVMQFNNIAAKKAIEQIAAKAGLPAVSCPNLISSVYGVYKDSAAGIIRSILETVTAENGVDYFPRVMGQTLVIRSFGETAIRGLCKPAENLAPFDVMEEAGAPRLARSIEDLKNAVTVYSEADETVSIQATAEDAASIARYGRRQALETFSDQDRVSASAKARTTLARLNRPSEEITLETYGSDRIVAGCRVASDQEGAQGEFWVLRARHSLGTPHRMALTLRRAT